MNVVSILLSEYARIVDGNQLVLAGTFNRVTVPHVPASIPPVYLSLVIDGHRDSERGRAHEIEIRVLNARRESVADRKLIHQFSFPDSEPAPGLHLRHIFVAGIGLTLTEVGPIAFEVMIDGVYHAAATLYVDVSSTSKG